MKQALDVRAAPVARQMHSGLLGGTPPAGIRLICGRRKTICLQHYHVLLRQITQADSAWRYIHLPLNPYAHIAAAARGKSFHIRFAGSFYHTFQHILFVHIHMVLLTLRWPAETP